MCSEIEFFLPLLTREYINTRTVGSTLLSKVLKKMPHNTLQSSKGQGQHFYK